MRWKTGQVPLQLQLVDDRLGVLPLGRNSPMAFGLLADGLTDQTIAPRLRYSEQALP